MRKLPTVVVLLPCALGYCLFVRWPGQRLRACSDIIHASELSEGVGSLDDPLLVVLAGRRNADMVSHAVLRHANLIIVPDAWLRRVPRTSLSARAALAAGIATTHRHARVEERLRRESQVELPF